MCGIAGYYKTNKCELTKSKLSHVFEGLMVAMEERGTDSAGIYTNGATHKMAVTASLLIEKSTIKYGDMAIGHTRFATRGEVTKDNAHPFRYENIVGVHNGIITNAPIKYAVDSMYLIEEFAKNDVQGLEKIQGSFAMLAYDEGTDKLHATAHSNPLFYADVYGAYIFASTQSSLEITLATIGLFAPDVYEVADDELVTFTRTKKPSIETFRAYDPLPVKKYDSYKPTSWDGKCGYCGLRIGENNEKVWTHYDGWVHKGCSSRYYKEYGGMYD